MNPKEAKTKGLTPFCLNVEFVNYVFQPLQLDPRLKNVLSWEAKK